MRVLLAVFLIGHAGVHAVMWTLPFTGAIRDMPFNPAHSWLLGDSRLIAVVLAAAAAAGFTATAVGYLLDTAWWPLVMLASAAVSLLLMAAYFSRWWSLGILLSAALAGYAWTAERAA
jgi:hypothetical protein